MLEALELYTVTDAFLDQIEDQPITAEIRANGILLTPSKALWFLANGFIAPHAGTPGPIRGVQPVRPKPLSELFAPSLTLSDDGRNFVFRAINGRLVVVEFKPEEYVPPDDPGDLTVWFKNGLI